MDMNIGPHEVVALSLNRKAGNPNTATVSVFDRGFLFGDGVYEVIRVYSGRPWLFERHIDRLRQSVAAIHIEVDDFHGLEQHARKLLQESGVEDGMIYIQVTRGASYPRQHAFPTGIRPTEFVLIRQVADPYQNLRKIGATAVTVSDNRWRNCGIKSINLLANVLANQTARNDGAVEALFVDRDGLLMEGSHTNVFFVRDRLLITPPATANILRGVTRDCILFMAQQMGIRVVEENLPISALLTFTECFVTGTMTEVLPIIAIDGKGVGFGRPGPITQAIAEKLDSAINEFRK